MKILIISEYIAPVGSIGAVRWTKISKYLSKNCKCTVDVLTNQKSYDQKNNNLTVYEYDDKLASDIGVFNRIFEIPEPLLSRIVNRLYNIFKIKQKNKKHKVEHGNYFQGKSSTVEKKDSYLMRDIWNLYRKLKDYPRISQGMSMYIDWESYDAIISSYGPKWVHLLAEKIKKKHPSITWIADYRDSLVFSEYTNKKENRDFPSKHTNHAECVTYVTPTFEDLMLPEGQECRWLHNGYDSSDRDETPRSHADKFYISVTGTLYDDGTNKSDLTPLFAALTELIKDNKVDSSDIEMLYCGRSGDKFTEQIEAYPLVPNRNFDLVSRIDALKIQSKSSILVLPVWHSQSDKGMISGRIYEYLSSRVPVLGLSSGDLPNSLVKEIIEDAGVGFCYEEPEKSEHFPLMIDFIEKKYFQWKLNGITLCEANIPYIEKFDYKQIAKWVYDLIEEMNNRAACEAKQPE